jgi:hypothetical protein
VQSSSAAAAQTSFAKEYICFNIDKRGVEERDNMMGETEGKVVRMGQRGQGRLEKGEGSTRKGREWEREGEMREGSGKRKRGEGGVDEEKDDGRSRTCKGRKGGE